MKKTFIKDITALVILAIVSSGVGFGIDQMRENSIGLLYRAPADRLVGKQKPLDSSMAPIKEETMTITAEIQVIQIEELQELLKQKQALVFDVRPNLFFKLGHIPGAYSLQEKEFETDLVKAKPLIEESLAKGYKVIVYCSSSHCSDASKVAQRLSDLGYGNLMIFQNGWEAWQQAGLKEEQENL